MLQVLIYKGTRNLGDAIQTYAMCRLLPGPLKGIYRDEASNSNEDDCFVVNGWLGNSTPENKNCLFSGVFLGQNEGEQIAWFRRSDHKIIGARDPFTYRSLLSKGFQSELIGCATMTFPRYDGHRNGTYYIDTVEDSTHTQHINHISWEEQWKRAEERINLIKSATLVVTTRLHIIVPCLAFGTPVVFPSKWLKRVGQQERLSLLDMFGFRYDVPFVCDLTTHAERYMRFLSTHLSIPINASDNPKIPLPEPRDSPS